jgi:hypothetical protein
MAMPTQGEARVYDAVQNPKPEAVVVYCGDPRFQTAFEGFIANELKLAKGQYIPLVVGGGAGVLAHPERLPKEFKFMKERLEMYQQLFHSIRRIILINHEDCKYYSFLGERVLGAVGSRLTWLADHAREDLPVVADVFKRLLAHLHLPIELHYASFADPEHTKIVFDQVKA